MKRKFVKLSTKSLNLKTIALASTSIFTTLTLFFSVLVISGPFSIDSNNLVPVILYHNVLEKPELSKIGYSISTEKFESHIKILKDKGYTAISLDDMNSYVYDGIPLPEKPVMITFDDGKLNNYENVYPILTEHGVKANMFVLGKHIDKISKDNKDKSREYINEYFNRVEMKQMNESGTVEFGSHTYDMHKKIDGIPMLLAKENIRLDLKKSYDVTKQITGNTAIGIAYPYGGYDERVTDIAKQTGYKLGFTTDMGVYKKGDNPLKIKRLNIDGMCSKYRLIFEIEALKIFSIFRDKVS